MARLLPVLALSDRVLLPGMMVRLHLTRPFDVAAVNHHLTTGAPLLAVPTRTQTTGDPLAEDMAGSGCLTRVLRAVDLGDGSLRVLLEGQQRARARAMRSDPDIGLTAAARPVADSIEDVEKVELLARQVTEELTELVKDDTRFPQAIMRALEIPVTPGRLADMVCAYADLPAEERLRALAEGIVDRRLHVALVALARERSLRGVTESVRKDVQKSMDKQQREFYLREQIRRLKAELGDTPSGPDEPDRLEQRIRESGLPGESLEEVLYEVERLRQMHPDASEYHVSRTWLDLLAQMPWKRTTPDEVDIAAAARILDEDHFGLEKVKERILEYLAVRQLKPDGKGPVLCFVGPPGVGKTSLGQSIARALGRSYQRASLGGVKDEAEIRGHRRTYVGALPGRIAQAIKRAGTKNPVIVLDELDKIGQDFRGDPASALLEVLDPEQNHAFVDHYLDVPFDLSQALFLCTANLMDPVPAALHDRLEVLELPGYILEDKIEIAKRHLLPRLREAHGLKKSQVKISDSAIEHVIESYTSEAGLRNLERELASIHRKAARRVVEGKKGGLSVGTPRSLQELLGPPRHFPELAERVDTPGIAIGLAWTAAGGDILFVEASRYPGKAGLKLTGKLGDVMKESAEAALTLVRTRNGALGIDPELFGSNEFHVHVPAGAIPKDGPSAGVTMVTALASLLTGRCVRHKLAMSGEVTLRGKVLPVGGVREKVLAARRAGIVEVILPRHNENDLGDVPRVLREELTYHFVDTVDQVLELALCK